MTKEEILDCKIVHRPSNIGNEIYNDHHYMVRNVVLQAMDEYAKQQVLLFHKYHSRYKMEDYVRTQRWYKEAGGIVTHRGYDIKDVYNDFLNLTPIKSESMEGIIYYFNTGEETNNIDQIKAPL